MKLFQHILLLLLLMFNSICVLSQDWKQVKSSNKEIQLFIDSSWCSKDVYHIKALTTVRLPISTLESLITTPEGYSNWLYRYDSAELLESREGQFVFRAIINAPTPLKDRKLKVLVSENKDSNGFSIFKLKRLKFPISSSYCSKCIEVEDMSGVWKLKANSENETIVIHEMNMKLESPLPRSFTYKLILKGPQKSLENLLSRKNN